MLDLTYEEIIRNWRYEPETGTLYWLKQKPKVPKTLIAGSSHPDGSIKVGLSGKRYRLHRIAWTYMTKETPPVVIDHIDGDPSNNKWSNLRAATHVKNQGNLNVSPKGFTKRGNKFEVSIRMNKQKIYLGLYKTIEEASMVYQEAHKKWFGEFSCFNRQTLNKKAKV